MMKRWRQLGIDSLLKTAGMRGTILAGLSAGAIVWYQWGHSDSRSFSGKTQWPYIKVKGLGLVEGLFCPHHDVENRSQPFTEMVLKHRTQSIACDNNAAVFYDASETKCITSKQAAKAYLYSYNNKRVSIKVYSNGDMIDV